MRLLRRLFHRKLSRERFANRMLRALSEAGATDLRYNDTEFSITIGEGRYGAYLGNAFAACRDADEATRREIIRSHVATALYKPLIPTSLEAAKSNLMPIIRDPAFASIMRLKLLLEGKATQGRDIVFKPLAEGLSVGLAYDSELSLTYVNTGMLQDWGVSVDEALHAAMENLRDRTNPSGWIQHGPGTFFGFWNDSYDCSRMLLTEYIHRLPLEGDPVVFVPNRERIWITGTSDLDGLNYILRTGKNSHFEEGHPISPNLYRLADRDWTSYVPEEPSLRELLVSIQRYRDNVDYHQQKQDLDTLHEKDQTDIFVASYNLFERTLEGRPETARFSVCVWTRGVESLLPKTENIVFLIDPETTDRVSVRWEEAIDVVGDLMVKHPDLLPVRYHVRTFPAEAQIARLRQIDTTESKGL